MLRKYLPFLLMIPVANALWAWGVLPRIGEEGTPAETFEWLVVQWVVPTLMAVLLVAKSRLARPLLCAYGVVLALYGVGTLGWALMGLYTPLPVYGVCALFLVAGFGLVFRSLKDLNVGRVVKRYHLDD
ncbi:MAG TPA: hypothetical protein VL404_05670 [Candidatus Eisenbacteria bacterium]|nr:hypothetical protein [Candidatus Eisenbacteria bacterium]